MRNQFVVGVLKRDIQLTCQRIKDLEQESRELLQFKHTLYKALGTINAEILNEKLSHKKGS